MPGAYAAPDSSISLSPPRHLQCAGHRIDDLWIHSQPRVELAHFVAKNVTHHLRVTKDPASCGQGNANRTGTVLRKELAHDHPSELREFLSRPLQHALRECVSAIAGGADRG